MLTRAFRAATGAKVQREAVKPSAYGQRRERKTRERERTVDAIGNRSSRSRQSRRWVRSFWVSLLNVRRPIKIISDETNESGFTPRLLIQIKSEGDECEGAKEERWGRNGGARRRVIYDGPDLITAGITSRADRSWLRGCRQKNSR